ncbi:MAG: SDR family oxidoreductase [Solirubrobacteraceae bacterium]
MRVFVTGASGGIGSAVVAELLAMGHEALGLARSDASAQALAAVGAEVQRGELADLESLRVAATQSDGVIHLAFSNDFTNLDEGIAQETRAIETLCGALEDSGKPLVIASGTPVVPGRASTEQDPTMTEGPVGGRGRASRAALAYAERGVRVGLVRLPRSVHAAGGPYGFASVLVAAAQRTGVSGYVGDGTQHWPAVHRLDAARLFRLVLEQGEPGTIAHAVGDEGDAMQTIAETIGRELNLPIEEVPVENFGVLGMMFAIDQPASSTLTREQLGWEPTHPSLLDDLQAGNYPD